MRRQSHRCYRADGKIAGKIRRRRRGLRVLYREKRESSYLITLYLSLSPFRSRESTRGGDPPGKNGKIRLSHRNAFAINGLRPPQSCTPPWQLWRADGKAWFPPARNRPRRRAKQWRAGTQFVWAVRTPYLAPCACVTHSTDGGAGRRNPGVFAPPAQRARPGRNPYAIPQGGLTHEGRTSQAVGHRAV